MSHEIITIWRPNRKLLITKQCVVNTECIPPMYNNRGSQTGFHEGHFRVLAVVRTNVTSSCFTSINT